jgi:6,7-dimethyl-8-ribityllumazine synthase
MIQKLNLDTEWSEIKVAIVAAKWNSFVTDPMTEGAIDALKAKGIPENQILLIRCPGAFELPLAVKNVLDNRKVDGVVAIGAVIRGETPHFDYVCDAVTRGIMDLNMKYSKPVAFGVLTTDNVEQAVKRASIEHGNKGAEAALAMCDMISIEVGTKRV